jgi:hypothetical protein
LLASGTPIRLKREEGKQRDGLARPQHGGRARGVKRQRPEHAKAAIRHESSPNRR